MIKSEIYLKLINQIRPYKTPPAILTTLFMCFFWFAGNGHAQHLEVPIHDPVMAEEDGIYYLFGTGHGISVWASEDMENWEQLDPVFEETPPWTEEIVEDGRYHLWAPDIIKHDDKYWLYYSVSSFGENTSAIGVLSNNTLNPESPDFEWTDHEKVVRSVPGRDMWNAIDPNIIIDEEGTPWMTFGSFWMGMKLVRLADNMIEIDKNPQEWHTTAARYRYWKGDERSASGAGQPLTDAAVEAPFIFKHQTNGYYYNFVSWDRCCRGEDSTYKIVVGRSKDVRGPYLDKEGQNMVHGGGSIVIGGDGERYSAIGHNAAYTFDGQDYFIAHAYDLSDEGRSKLIILEMDWDEDGWPVVTLD